MTARSVVFAPGRLVVNRQVRHQAGGRRSPGGPGGAWLCGRGADKPRCIPKAQVQRAGHLEQRDHGVLVGVGQALPDLGVQAVAGC